MIIECCPDLKYLNFVCAGRDRGDEEEEIAVKMFKEGLKKLKRLRVYRVRDRGF
jgi:hypothetical protein